MGTASSKEHLKQNTHASLPSHLGTFVPVRSVNNGKRHCISVSPPLFPQWTSCTQPRATDLQAREGSTILLISPGILSQQRNWRTQVNATLLMKSYFSTEFGSVMPVFWRGNRQNTLYKFKAYNIMIWSTYILWNKDRRQVWLISITSHGENIFPHNENF